MRGEFPEWVPSYSYYGPLPGVDEVPPNMSIRLPILSGTRNAQGGFDLWGVPYESVDLVGGFSLPKPGEFILKDIRDWPKVVKKPDFSDIDWDQYIKHELDSLPYDRNEVALFYNPGNGLFMQLMGLMGFSEGLCAMYEEPETVYELFEFMTDFYYGIATKVIDLIKPDIIGLGDDTASERAPFISPQTYRELLLPFYSKFAQMGVLRGCPINMHNCGKSGVFFDDLVRIGVTSWEPVQLSNDISEIQKRYGRHLVIGGGWEGRGRLTEPDVTDEEIRESVRVCLDSYAKDAGFMFAAAYTPGSLNDERTAHWNAVLQKEAYDYGHTFYK
jgi:hypothetical protein